VDASQSGEPLRRASILALLLGPLIALHLHYLPRLGPFSLDGSYYVQGARFFVDENRLMTGVSLYHEGLVVLPSPWESYPLWPLLLGIAGKAMGLVAAANALPQLFYALDLVLFAVLASRMHERLGGTAAWRIGDDALDVSHLVPLVVGLNFVYFESTVYPYTEGLAFALGIAALLLIDRVDSPVAIAGAGVLAGLSCLARYQMVALPLAAALVFLLVRKIKAFAIFCAATTIVVLPWMLYARSLLALRAGIESWDEWIHMPTPGGSIWQLVRGIGVAFDPLSPASYFASFGVLVLLLPLALFARPRMAILPATAALTGILAALMLAHYESIRFDHWLFGERHSLLLAFTIVAALVYAVARGGAVVRALAIAIALCGCVQGGYEIVSTPPPAGTGPTRAERALGAWLATHAPHASVLSTNAHILSVYLHNPLQWTDCGVSPERTRIMLRRLNVGYVVVYGNERNCAFVRGLGDVLNAEATFEDEVVPISIYSVKR
jgi:hypothetical protein